MENNTVFRGAIPEEKFEKCVDDNNIAKFVVSFGLYELFANIQDINELVDEILPWSVYGLSGISYKVVGHDENNNVHIQVEGEVDWEETK